MHFLSSGGARIGGWNGAYQEAACWDTRLIDLGNQTRIGSLVYYEVGNLSNPGNLAKGWVIVYVSSRVDGPWKLIFYWGNGDLRINGNIPSGISSQENNSQRIGLGDLFNQTGIQIPVGGIYRYVMILAQPRCDDPAQVGRTDILP